MVSINKFSFKIILLSFVLILITGCSKQVNKKAAQGKNQAAFFVDDLETNIDLSVARIDDQLLVDVKYDEIPSMIGSTLLESDQMARSDGQIFLRWACMFDQPLIIEFYQQEMVVRGWQQVGQLLDEKENLLIFKKPKKLCIVSIRSLASKPNKSTIYIFVCDKMH